MNLNTENAQTIIERDIHCPYFDSEKALLISEIADKRSIRRFTIRLRTRRYVLRNYISE